MGIAGSTTSGAAVVRVAEAFRQGAGSVLPVEGGYVVAARTIKRDERAWMAGDREELASAAGAFGGAAARLIRRLTPGPVVMRFAGELSAPAPAGVRAARVTAHPFTSAVVKAVGVGVVGVEAVDGRGQLVRTAEEAQEVARGMGIDVDVEGIPEPLGRLGATILEFEQGTNPPRGGAVPKVVRAGGYEERFIRKQLAMNVLFVCTGNTCRSPMAEAIASALAAKDAGAGVELKFVSAGTAAANGGGPSAEAVSAVRGLEIGASLGGHRSRPLTRKLIAEADAIYTMGRSHLHAILELEPEAAEKAQLLDPDGRDVPDPVGMSGEVYTQTAKSIMAMWKRRMKELGR